MTPNVKCRTSELIRLVIYTIGQEILDYRSAYNYCRLKPENKQTKTLNQKLFRNFLLEYL